MLLAYEFQELLETGVVNNRAGIARQYGLSRARITQVMKLLDLPEKIQEHVVSLLSEGQHLCSGRRLRDVATLASELAQLRAFEQLRDQVS